MVNLRRKLLISAINNMVDSGTCVHTCVTEFVAKLVPNEFFFAPSSSTGKYHPPEDNGDGGVLIHTLKGMQIASDLCRLYEVEKRGREVAVCAMALHDTYKSCTSPDMNSWERYTNSHHGKNVAIAFRQFYEAKIDRYRKCEDALRKITKLVYIHMGRWSKPDQYRAKLDERLEQIVIESDYLSSRSGISFLPKCVLPDYNNMVKEGVIPDKGVN